MRPIFSKYLPFGVAIFLLFPASIVFAKDELIIDRDTSSPAAVYMSYMNSMMDNMEKQSSTISPEVDFLQQMIAHHQGAIEMAAYEISHGTNFDMIQLAKSILQEQRSEVNMMCGWLHSSTLTKEELPPNYQAVMKGTMRKMMDNMMADHSMPDADHSFAQIMIPHHMAAIDMASAILLYASKPAVMAYARLLISNEAIEIEQMQSFIQ